MGKNLRQQKRGRGGPRYLSPGHRFLARPCYPVDSIEGTVLEILHAPGRSTPLALVDFGGHKKYVIPHGKMQVGQKIDNKSLEEGNILQLKNVPEGTKIFNIELLPGDGGRFCRSSGTFATMVTRGEKKCVLLMPSKEKKVLSGQCRATMGTAASSGRVDKPFMKAGTKFFAMRTRNKMWPRTSGVHMNACNHPFGGQTRPGKHKTVSRHMPPGKKVGSISPRRTGRK
jgi:large subunit ribosomal protein L2